MKPRDFNRADVDLQSDGLLWLINRALFHPRGFALAVKFDGSFELWGNGDEPWRFEQIDEDELFAKAEAAFDKVRPTPKEAP